MKSLTQDCKHEIVKYVNHRVLTTIVTLSSRKIYNIETFVHYFKLRRVSKDNIIYLDR